LIATGYSADGRGVIHVFGRDGMLHRSLGPQPPAGRIPPGFVSSLLGGNVAVDDSLIVYSNKSPYELRFFDTQGRARGSCAGDRSWTTPPGEAFEITGDRQTILWPDYVHATEILVLARGVYLNQVLRPRERRVTLDLVRSDCTLLDRRIAEAGLILSARRGDLVAGALDDGFPQVVVYRYRIGAGR
jgi:hypothetical protein